MENRKFLIKSLNIFITEKCNLNCRYCFVKKELQEHQLDFPSLKKVIDWFLSFPGERKTISFNGGEPLLEYPLLKKTFLYAKRKAKEKNIYLDIALMTNGTLLSKPICRFLERNQSIVKISIDGDKTTHDFNRPFKENSKRSSFEKIIKNIKNFQPNKLKLAASLVFTPKNVNSLFKNIKFLQKQGFFYIEFYPDMYAFWSKKELNILRHQFEEIRKYYISLFLRKETSLIFANSLMYSIFNRDEVTGTLNIMCEKVHLAPDGKIYLCDKVFSLPKKEREKYIIGNIKSGVDLQKRINFLSNIEKRVKKILGENCSKCAWNAFCFCPIGHYLYFSFHDLNYKKHFANFCSVAKIYLENFITIKEKLKFNPLFVSLYKF